MIITNLKKLARDSFRKKALEIAEAGYEAIDIEKVISQKIELKGNKLSIGSVVINHHTKKYLNIDLNNYENVFVIGIGKGSALACASLAKILGKKLSSGIALDVQKPKLEIGNLKLEILTGTHPLPSQENIKATQEIIKLAKNAGEKDLIISFICGGGSTLLCGSKNELSASRTIFKELTKKGANIIELNTVRKHLSEVKGGGLAKMVYPTTMISLIVSDVLGNDLSMVASGPTIYDKTTKKDAQKILEKYFSNSQFPISNFQLTETPEDKKYFRRVKNILFLSNREPVLAMQKKAKKLGFKTKIRSLKLNDEAKDSLLPLMEAVKEANVVLAAGETTVKFSKPFDAAPASAKASAGRQGKGGRNQEVVLGAIILNSKLKTKNLVLMSFSSDGHDNTEAAGAIADFSTIEKAKKLKLDQQKYLENHDSFNFFKKTGDLIFTEPKTFNVSDLMIILKGMKPR